MPETPWYTDCVENVISLREVPPLALPAPIVPKLALEHLPVTGDGVIIIPPTESPNTKVSRQLDIAYAFYNKVLFDGKLGHAYLHLQRKKNALGFFWARRMEVDGKIVHEIALDPEKLMGRSLEDILSTIVHEMVHFWQQDYGVQRTNVAHNKEWANKMESIGLMPSSTGCPGGKRTGMKVSHYIIKGGPFELATRDLLESGYRLTVKGTPNRTTTTKWYRTTFQCIKCKDTALAKRSIQLICGKCNLLMTDKCA